MTDIRFHCPKCGGNLVVDEKAATRRITCPHCSRRVFVPTESTEPPSASSRDPLQLAPEVPRPKPTTHAVQGAPGSYRVWVKCPGCGHTGMHIQCFGCGSEDKFWVQHDGALCYCGTLTTWVRCLHCNASIRRSGFRALIEPIHAHGAQLATQAVTGGGTE